MAESKGVCTFPASSRVSERSVPFQGLKGEMSGERYSRRFWDCGPQGEHNRGQEEGLPREITEDLGRKGGVPVLKMPSHH